jgi:hypothetical protein
MNIADLLTALDEQCKEALEELASLAEADKDDFTMVNIHHGECLSRAYGAVKLCQSYLSKAGYPNLAKMVMEEWTEKRCDEFWAIRDKYYPAA